MISFRVVFSPPLTRQHIATGLQRFHAAMAFPIQLLSSWGSKLVNWSRERITSGTDIHGQTFTALAPSTRRRRGANAKPLDTGHAGGLLESITYRIGAPTPLLYLPQVQEIGPTANVLEVGAAVVSTKGAPYPAFVNYGTSRGVPAREWSGLSEENRAEMASDFDIFVREKLREAFSV